MGTRDPEATKRRILDAALREFSDKGIAGARVDAIAERAGVNKRMLYYYFGSKQGLFHEILQRRIDEGSVAMNHPDIAEPGRLARRQANLTQEEDYVRLLAWEALEARSGPVIDESIRRAFYKQWIKAVEAEQRAGNLPGDLDAAQLVLSELCLVLGPLLVPQLTRLITGCSPTGPRQLERRAAFLNVLERRITAPEHTPSPIN
ncbi:MAG: TetR family transcriptional regulator [Acidimicrobiia bacterium]